MHTRSRLVFGSLAGALSIHLVMVACSSGGAPPSSDAGHDAGLLADVRDAIVDVVNDVLDAETRDAIAGGDGGVADAGPGDGGTPACSCMTPQPEYTFSGGAVSFDGQTYQPTADFSRATANAGSSRQDNQHVINVGFTLRYYLTNNATVELSCSTTLRPDRTIVPIEGPMRGEFHDGSCSSSTVYRSAERNTMGNGLLLEGSLTPDRIDGIRVTELTDERVTVQTPALVLRLTRDGGAVVAGSIAPITVRGYTPGQRATVPSRAYRP
jgi:hypothetical protein